MVATGVQKLIDRLELSRLGGFGVYAGKLAPETEPRFIVCLSTAENPETIQQLHNARFKFYSKLSSGFIKPIDFLLMPVEMGNHPVKLPDSAPVGTEYLVFEVPRKCLVEVGSFLPEDIIKVAHQMAGLMEFLADNELPYWSLLPQNIFCETGENGFTAKFAPVHLADASSGPDQKRFSAQAVSETVPDRFMEGVATFNPGERLVRGYNVFWNELPVPAEWEIKPLGSDRYFRISASEGPKSLKLMEPYAGEPAVQSTFRLRRFLGQAAAVEELGQLLFWMFSNKTLPELLSADAVKKYRAARAESLLKFLQKKAPEILEGLPPIMEKLVLVLLKAIYPGYSDSYFHTGAQMNGGVAQMLKDIKGVAAVHNIALPQVEYVRKNSESPDPAPAPKPAPASASSSQGARDNAPAPVTQNGSAPAKTKGKSTSALTDKRSVQAALNNNSAAKTPESAPVPAPQPNAENASLVQTLSQENAELRRRLALLQKLMMLLIGGGFILVFGLIAAAIYFCFKV